jgi:4-amino-4-deoxy-L-arabinose transferase-like glycosyltransferase
VCNGVELCGEFSSNVSRMRSEKAFTVPWKRLIPMTVALLFFAFQLHQLFSFNPYWGYDGGAHVHILETLLFEHRFPTLAENYLAWHEPLYYLVLVGFGFLHVPFIASHAVIIGAIDVLVFLLWRRMGLSVGYAVFGAIVTLSLPAFLEVGMFFTNEALNYVFVLAIIHCALTLWREEQWSWKSSFVFALCVGLGVVTKITALVAFGVVVVLLGVKMLKMRTWKYMLTIVGALVISVACYAPWYAIRSNGLSQASINNYDMLPPQELAWDDRVTFMTRFDTDIFTFPFWYSGGTGFWSMLYADTVSDYLGIFENQDVKNALSVEERVMTTHNGNSVSAYRKPLAQALMWLGLIPVGVMLLGVGRGVWGMVMKKWGAGDELAILGFSSAFLLALMYYAYRYPYYDQGVVKSIFIAPAFVLPLAMGVRMMTKWPRWVQGLVFGLWGVYVTVVIALFFVKI